MLKSKLANVKHGASASISSFLYADLTACWLYFMRLFLRYKWDSRTTPDTPLGSYIAQLCVPPGDGVVSPTPVLPLAALLCEK